MIVYPRSLLFTLGLLPIVRNSLCSVVTESSFNESENSIKNVNIDGTTTEIHYTTCKITTEQSVTEAQAKFTVLAGACNARAYEERFEKLEKFLNERLDEMREIILRPSTNNADFFKKIERPLTTVNEEKNESLENMTEDDSELDHEFNYKLSSARQGEIKRYNDSVYLSSEEKRKVYSYYWHVWGLSKKFERKTYRTERGPSFYVGNTGYAMYFSLQLFPASDDQISINVGITTGKNDSSITWPFQLPFRIQILDPSSKKHDGLRYRNSRLFVPTTKCSAYYWDRPQGKIVGVSSDNPTCVGFAVSKSQLLLMGRNGVSVDSLLAKLTVYLD